MCVFRTVQGRGIRQRHLLQKGQLCDGHPSEKKQALYSELATPGECVVLPGFGEDTKAVEGGLMVETGKAQVSSGERYWARGSWRGVNKEGTS